MEPVRLRCFLLTPLSLPFQSWQVCRPVETIPCSRTVSPKRSRSGSCCLQKTTGFPIVARSPSSPWPKYGHLRLTSEKVLVWLSLRCSPGCVFMISTPSEPFPRNSCVKSTTIPQRSFPSWCNANSPGGSKRSKKSPSTR